MHPIIGFTAGLPTVVRSEDQEHAQVRDDGDDAMSGGKCPMPQQCPLCSTAAPGGHRRTAGHDGLATLKYHYSGTTLNVVMS